MTEQRLIRGLTLFGGAAAALLAFAAPVSALAPPQLPAATCGDAALVKPDGTPWICTLDDEFSASSLDRVLWVPQRTAISGFATGPDGARACYEDDPANITQADGYLDLTARAEPSPFVCRDPQGGDFTTQYTSGEVTTHNTFSQTYGRFEVRAKLPQTTAKGLQETFWLWPDDDTKYGPWPESGEVDFAEFFSEFYYLTVPTLHYALDPATIDTTTDTNIYTAYDCYIDYTQFNTYGFEWLPGRLTVYVNGQACITDNYRPSNVDAPAPFDQPFFLALTQALGVSIAGNDNAFDPAVTPLPATTQIDYVRAWK